MRFDISRSLNGEQIIYIARDANGIVRLRSNSLEELQEAIKEYKPPSREIPKKEITVKAHEEESTDSEASESPLSKIVDKETSQPEEDLAAQLVSEPATEEKEPEPKKEFLKSDLKEKVEEKKKRTSKGSFWDKLK